MTKNAFILNFFKLYNMPWRLSLPFLKKNKRLKLGFQKRITSFHHTKTDIWIQAASAGEAYLAVTLLKTFNPKTRMKILVTSTTSQGIHLLNSRLTKKTISELIALKIEWFPFDSPHIMKEAVRAINPSIMVLLETEIWPALLFYLKKNHTRIFIINARLSQKSFNHYMRTRFLWKHLAPDYILATSKQDARRYEQIFIKTIVKTMPNIKFESIGTDTPDLNSREQIKKLLPQTLLQTLPLTILASVRRQEEKDIIKLLKNILKRFPNQIVAIFPRHMHRISSWKKRLTSQNLDFHLRSEINAPLAGPGIILWDIFGELKAAYGFACVVFVGGSLEPLGGQNFIEPAVQGAITVTGPYYDDFAWATNDIFKQGIVIKKNNWETIAKTIIKTLKTPVDKSENQRLALEYLKSNQGGTRQAWDEILTNF